MKKFLLIAILVVIVGYIGWQIIQTKPDENTPEAIVTTPEETSNDETNDNQDQTPGERSVNNEAVKVSFKGFGPGKVHTGTFTIVDSKLRTDATTMVQGEISVDMNSLTSDNEQVTKHLKTAEFFDVAKYPTATFGFQEGIVEGRGMGTMTIKGIRKDISFPVITLETFPEQYSATFTLNLKDFGINQTFANETIELSILVPLK